MSAEVDSGGTNPPSKFVRIQSTPEYIPTITGNVLIKKKHSAKSTSSEDGGRQVSAQKQWGRIKNVAQIQSDLQSEISDCTEDDQSPTKPLGVLDFQRTAKLLMRSNQLIKKVKTRYSGDSMRKLLERSSSSLDVSEFGSNLDTEMFNNYSLTDVHKKLRKQRHIKLAVLQQQFLNDLPALAHMSVKQRLLQKIEILERMRGSGDPNGVAPSGVTVSEKDEVELPPQNSLARRKSRLRKSVDQTSFPAVDLNKCLPALPNARKEEEIVNPIGELTVADINRELALSRSRQRIESELNLPEDRLVRLSILKANVNKINSKFSTLLKGSKAENGEKESDSSEEKLYYVPSRFTQTGMAKLFFQKYARLVLIVTQWISMIMNKKYDFEKELKSFVDIANEIEDKVVSSAMSEFGLTFDKKFFKANKEISLSSEVRKILTTRYWSRTPKMIKQVLNGLQSLRSLSEYPMQTQEKLCKVAWYQTIGPKKLIVRQGHHAESFYFILSGMAFVKKMIQDPVTGETKAQVAARLTKGHSFGEIGLLFDTLRTATVESATPMELLVIGKEDFVRIFMKAENPDDEPDHIKFLKRIPFMDDWPIEVLKLEPGACLTHYFKRGSLITDNDRHSEWLYIIMSGTCEVLKKLKAVKGRHPSEMRPKSDPMVDIILPELGMPSNYAKIYTGKTRSKRRTIHPAVFKDMSDFYDSLRRKYAANTPKTPAPEDSPTADETFFDMPDQTDLQTPKMFISTASPRRFSGAETPGPRVRFLEDKQKTDVDIYDKDFKIVPLMAVENKRRPASRARLDESTPKMKREHFRLPSREKLAASYRPTSRDNDISQHNHAMSGDVFVQVDLLYPKHCFGLNTLKYVLEADDEVFDVGAEETPILSLVSRGAEVIMLSKKVFLKYADQRCKIKVREQIKPYPSEDILQDNMQREADWTVYKETLLSQYIEKKVKKEKPRSRSNMY